MQPVSPTGARLLAPAKPLQPLSKQASQGVSDFVRAARTAGAAPLAGNPDVIDVEVIWEDAEEAYAPQQAAARPSSRPSRPPLRLTEPGAAIAAYRSAATTAALPHQTIDVFA